MDPILYRAAKEGKIDVLQQYAGQFRDQLTPNHNTVLHIAALFGKAECIRQILALDRTLLCEKNVRGDTALHLAAREGHSQVIIALLPDPTSENKEILKATNQDGDTALHEAVRSFFPRRMKWFTIAFIRCYCSCRPKFDHKHIFAFRKLIDPDLSYPANNAGETPLYLAAERGHDIMVKYILEICRRPTHGGPGGRTAMHASVISNNQESTAELLKWDMDLAKGADKNGWTPLHYAANFGHVQRATQLLQSDKSIAYLSADNDNKMTALHVAASQGHVSVIDELISHGPDCWEMVTARGQNILHIAVENGAIELIRFILRNLSIRSLISQKDNNGNTPLHLLETCKCNPRDLIGHPMADRMAFNKDNWTPLDLLTYSQLFTSFQNQNKSGLELSRGALGWRNIISQRDKFLAAEQKALTDSERTIPTDIRKTGDSCLIVAALIATVTFAAGFTMPGGYDGNEGPNQGMAILSREAAFKAFMVTDTISLILAISSVFLLHISSTRLLKYKVQFHYNLALWFCGIAMAAMILAFMTGTYAVLGHSSSLATSICVIGSFSFLLSCLFLKMKYRLSVSRNKT